MYHSRAAADPISRKELRRAKTLDHAIAGDLDRVCDESDRIVVAFTQDRDGSTTELEAELRPEEGDWRLFDLRRAAAHGVGNGGNI